MGDGAGNNDAVVVHVEISTTEFRPDTHVGGVAPRSYHGLLNEHGERKSKSREHCRSQVVGQTSEQSHRSRCRCRRGRPVDAMTSWRPYQPNMSADEAGGSVARVAVPSVSAAVVRGRLTAPKPGATLVFSGNRQPCARRIFQHSRLHASRHQDFKSASSPSFGRTIGVWRYRLDATAHAAAEPRRPLARRRGRPRFIHHDDRVRW